MGTLLVDMLLLLFAAQSSLESPSEDVEDRINGQLRWMGHIADIQLHSTVTNLWNCIVIIFFALYLHSIVCTYHNFSLFGGEDGEEPWEMDDVQAEGFDDL